MSGAQRGGVRNGGIATLGSARHRLRACPPRRSPKQAHRLGKLADSRYGEVCHAGGNRSSTLLFFLLPASTGSRHSPLVTALATLDLVACPSSRTLPQAPRPVAATRRVGSAGLQVSRCRPQGRRNISAHGDLPTMALRSGGFTPPFAAALSERRPFHRGASRSALQHHRMPLPAARFANRPYNSPGMGQQHWALQNQVIFYGEL